MKPGFENVSRLIDSYESQMVGTMSGMIPLKALSPSSGGTGESERANFLESTLKSWGLDTKRYDYVDGTGAVRPNILTKIGSLNRTVWFVAHLDPGYGNLKPQHSLLPYLYY